MRHRDDQDARPHTSDRQLLDEVRQARLDVAASEQQSDALEFRRREKDAVTEECLRDL